MILPPRRRFQCSSASRKFLNALRGGTDTARGVSFSALQRAENSSIGCAYQQRDVDAGVSVLFSEPKIPQCSGSFLAGTRTGVSVLFSEPKIPQSKTVGLWSPNIDSFSALQRAENSSIRHPLWQPSAFGGFSALQRAENSSIAVERVFYRTHDDVSVLFSEPKIPQSITYATASCTKATFQCSSASRKFLNRRGAHTEEATLDVSVLFSEPKIPQ